MGAIGNQWNRLRYWAGMRRQSIQALWILAFLARKKQQVIHGVSRPAPDVSATVR
jgi:hypothetical protein